MFELNQENDHQNAKQGNQQQSPKTYFDLILKVGSDGPYQRNIFILFFCNWFITYMLVLQTVFLFMNTSIDCKKLNLDQQACHENVCRMQIDQQKNYLKKIQIQSIITQFGPFICENQYLISAAKTTLFFGVFLGYIVFLFFSDNFGRKFSIILTWTYCTIGLIILVTAPSIEFVCIGLFLAGSGCQSAIRINMNIFAQVFDYHKRQTYSVALQISLGFAGILVAVLYKFLQNWRTINIFFVCIPSLIILIFLIQYLEQTPKFQIKKDKLQAVKSLNRIGLINKGIDNLISVQDIDKVIQHQMVDHETTSRKISIIDIFRYDSLRKKTICMCIVFFSIAYIYYEAAFLVDQLGSNIYFNQVAISVSQMIAYIVVIPFITVLPRRLSGVICFCISVALSAILIIIPKNQQCDNQCVESVISIICAFVIRFAISFYHCILFVYVNEMFPTRARGIGFGLCSAAGALSATLGNLILTFLKLHNLSSHLMNIPLLILAIIALINLKQTLDMPLQHQIQEILTQKQKIKKAKIQLTSLKN